MRRTAIEESLCLPLGSRFPTDDAGIVARQEASVGPFQFTIEMLTEWRVVPLFPLHSQRSRLSHCH